MDHKDLINIPYCYFIGWPKLNKFYYGVKFGIDANPETFWKTYFTSSGLVTQYRELYGEPSVIKVRKIFDPNIYGSLDSAQFAAITYETKVIRRMNMVLDNRFLNCSNNFCNRTGKRMTNHTKYRNERFGQYHSVEGLKSIREFNKVYLKLHNPMSRPEVKEKHLNSIAKKNGYTNHREYLDKIKSEFEKYKTIKTTAEKTGHAQYTIRHLLINNFGKEWLEKIRKEGLDAGKIKSINSNRNRPKRNAFGDQNYNAYVWEAISPSGKTFIIKGNRLGFCKTQGIGRSLDPKKPHLRGFWEFRKICKVKDYKEKL